MPPATIASVITRTRKTLRTDHSMRRASMSVPLVAGGGGRSLLRGGRHRMTRVRISGFATAGLGLRILAGARGRPMSCVTFKSLKCGLQIAFGVDQEVGGDHDLLAFGDPIQNLHAIAAAPPQRDVPR